MPSRCGEDCSHGEQSSGAGAVIPFFEQTKREAARAKLCDGNGALWAGIASFVWKMRVGFELWLFGSGSGSGSVACGIVKAKARRAEGRRVKT
jgi:hypothetical protein